MTPAARPSAASESPTAGAFIVDLRQVTGGDLLMAGGKGANLGSLLAAGFPVPPGFVVTTAAYQAFVSSAGLTAVIADELGQGRAQPGAGSIVRSAFATAPLPDHVVRAVSDAYASLGEGPVAMRSSATAEDLPGAAFAGQQDTYLNVIGPRAVLEAVRSCFASLWTDRAISYRERLGIDPATVKLAVVVQRMVDAEAAGVMFTANPVTGARDEVVIDASPGLGEAVVAGLVTPDHHVLRRGVLRFGWRVVESRPGLREVVVRATPGGGTSQAAAADVVTDGATGSELPAGSMNPAATGDHQRPAVPTETVRRLARLGVAIERHFGAPQDIEWATSGGDVFIVQSRPMTVLPERTDAPSLPQRLFAGVVGEMLPFRPYPLESSTLSFERIFSELLGPIIRTLGIRLQTEGLFEEREGVVVRYTSRLPVRPTAGVFLAPFRLARLARRYDHTRWDSDPILSQFIARAKELEQADVDGLGWPELLSGVNDSLSSLAAVGELRRRYLGPRALDILRLRLLVGVLGAGDSFGTMVMTGVETKTLESNRELERLEREVRGRTHLASMFERLEPDVLLGALAEDPQGAEFMELLRAFLTEFGHREVGGTLQLSRPSWREEPGVVLGILKGMLRGTSEPLAGPPGQPASSPPWQQARDAVLGLPVMRRLPPLRASFERLLARARYFPAIREDTRFFATMPSPRLRSLLLEMGDRLRRAGALDDRHDVFLLRFGELEAVRSWPPTSAQIADMRVKVEDRRAVLESLGGTPLVDPRLLKPAARSGNALHSGDALVTGLPGSPGLADGVVRVIRDSTEFGRLQPGEVLVAPFTNPAWTPLFEIAAAVIVDSGGPASHAAIVAREYGIPAVMGTVVATSTLTDGQPVRVDGTSGVVVAGGPGP